MPTTDPSRPGRGATARLALADRCVQCGLCLPHCPTYRLDRVETESPRGRIAYIKAVADGSLAPTPAGDLHLEHCLGCRRCEGACPAGVEYGALLLLGREEVFRRVGLPAALRRRLRLLARPRWLSRLLGVYRLAFPVLPRRWRPLPRPPAAAAGPRPGSAPAGTAVFVGCVADRYEVPARAALARLAAAAGWPLVQPEGQGCCGAAAAHAGDVVQAGALADANRLAFAGHARVLCLASGCQDVLAASLEGQARVEDACAALATRAEALRFRDAGGRRVAVHRPCTQFALPGSLASLRALLAKVPGLEVIELPDTGCCGAAGMHMLEFPDRAARLREDLLGALQRSGAGEMVSANLGCRLHLANGSLVPVRHPLELLAEFLV
jgi:glycolate oxidase iron-sulfur subunit